MEFPEATVVAGVIDDIDEDLVLLQRLRYVVERRLTATEETGRSPISGALLLAPEGAYGNHWTPPVSHHIVAAPLRNSTKTKSEVFLLDTNVISELRRPRPKTGPSVRWGRRGRRPDRLLVSAVTIGEIQAGIEITHEHDSGQGRAIKAWQTVNNDRHFARLFARSGLPEDR